MELYEMVITIDTAAGTDTEIYRGLTASEVEAMWSVARELAPQGSSLSRAVELLISA